MESKLIMYNYELSLPDIKEFFKDYPLQEVHLNLLVNNFYRSRDKSLDNFSQLPQSIREKAKELNPQLPSISYKQTAVDGTTKFLVKLNDNEQIEMVLLPFYKKFTLCVSSQVGCAMGCEFCFTAKQGFKRNLKVSEIIGQVLLAKDYLKQNNEKRELTNIVFMGQGEPLHNFENLKKSIQILTLRNGISISERNITVSSVGFIPGLKRFNELGGVNFALSLHAVDEKKRSEIIPLNQKYPLPLIFDEIEKIKLRNKQTIEYEYILIKNFNDAYEDAKALFEVLNNRTHMINIIPFNPFPHTHLKKPNEKDVQAFKEYLVKLGLRAMIRTTKGDEILAACGQLNSSQKEVQ